MKGADVKKEIATLAGSLQKLSEQEAKYSAELDEALKQYAELKEQAEKVFAENGMTLEEATILFFEETVRLGRLPFELDDDLREYIAKQLDTPASDSAGGVRP